MTSIRPAKPVWQQGPRGPVAATALGEFSVFKGEDDFWYAHLNDCAFPILYSEQEQAKTAAGLVAALSGHPSGMDFEWMPNDAGGISAQTSRGHLHVVPSETIQGFFVMKDETPAAVPMATAEEAQEACAQYLVYVWFALSEVVS